MENGQIFCYVKGKKYRMKEKDYILWKMIENNL